MTVVAGLLLTGAGVVVGWLLHHLLPGIWRSAQGKEALDVHVEKDLSILLAGQPPWIPAVFVFSEGSFPAEPPPGHCPEWWAWAKRHGGADGDETHVQVTLVGASEMSVVVTGIRAQVSRRSEPSGIAAVCPVAGADVVPRHFGVQLDVFDTPVTWYTDPRNDDSRVLTFSVAKGEAEVIDIVGRSRTADVEWTAELLMIVNQKRRIVRIDNDGKPFRTCGADPLKSRTWSGGDWRTFPGVP